MALTPYTAATDIIESLGTNPEDRPTLTDETFKAKFDENAANIKAFLNALIAELASTDAGKGASAIGVEDAGGLITATTVEAALAELAGTGRTTESLKSLADMINDIKGEGWTDETLKGLADLISTMTADNLKYAEYTLSGNQSVASSATPSAITWGTKTAINSEAFTALDSGNVKILTAGVYEVCISVVFASNSTGIRALHGAVNGSRKGNSLVNASSSTTGLTLTFLVNASVNDLITAQVAQTSGGALDVLADARYAYLQIRKVG
jgi:hypothetical protein